jgi:hypothetical protein
MTSSTRGLIVTVFEAHDNHHDLNISFSSVPAEHFIITGSPYRFQPGAIELVGHASKHVE